MPGMLGLLVQFCTSHKEMDVITSTRQLALGGERVFPGGPSHWPHLKLAGFLYPETLAFAVMCEERERFPLWFWLGVGPAAVTGMLICLCPCWGR